jgi:anti-sigma regulatory factor (Ser/Thr protein kinase)
MAVTQGATEPAATDARPGWAVARAFVRAATSVAKIRAWVRERLGAASVSPDAVAVAELLVSEIATNAVRHGSGNRIMVRLSMDGELEAAVHDADPCLPALRQAASVDETGRGLALVQSLASVWGTDRVRSGKWVWFRITVGGAEPVATV